MTIETDRGMLVKTWVERDHLLISKRAARRLLELAEVGEWHRGVRVGCDTLGEIAELRPRHILGSSGVGKATVSDIADSLARAGVGVRWRTGAPRPTGEQRQQELRDALMVPAREVSVQEWINRDRELPGRAYGVLERLSRVLGPYDYGRPRYLQAAPPVCATLGEVAALSRKEALQLHNSGEKTLRDIADSLGRAGVAVEWSKPIGPAATLRNNLAVLAAAWASNANHSPHPGTGCAWKAASDALDELLGAPHPPTQSNGDPR